MSNVPNTLLRFYKREEYARSFIGGEIRFGYLDHYKSIEGSRKDPKEGQVSFEWAQKATQIILDKKSGQVVAQAESDQNIRYSGISLNPHFILCTSHPEADKRILEKKFGQFIIRINDPTALLERIKTAWQSHPWAFDGCAFIAPVIYNKGELVEPDRYLIAPPEYSYSQKSKSDGEGNSFEEEKEFRYVLKCTVDPERTLEEYLPLRLPDCSDICSLI